MITTITLNASVDKLYLLEDVELNTVMRVREVRNTAGGKGLNVSRVAVLLGEEVRAMGFVGGHNGQYLRAMLKFEGVVDDFTEIEGETRSCINIRDLTTGKHTELLEPGAPITDEDAQALYLQFVKALDSSGVVTISGSVPLGTPPCFYNRLIAAAKKWGKPVILDTSGLLLAEALAAKPTMIKPNADEIAQLLGKPISSRSELIGAAKQLHDSGIAYIVVSLGAEGALMVCGEGIFQATPPDVPVVNTVGCGDSMVAAFAVGMARGYTAEYTLAYATAVSTSNAKSMQTGYADANELPLLQKQVLIKKIY